MKKYSFLLLVSFLIGLIFASCSEGGGHQKLFAGGFTEGDEKGLSLFEFDNRGNLKLIAEADAGSNPSYFCFSERHDLIYALNEVPEFNGSKGGGITTLFYDQAAGKVQKKSELVVPYGGPCHISLSADSSFLFVASYGSGSVAVVRLDSEGIPERVTDTILYEREGRNVSHPHMIMHDPAGKYVYLADLGLNRIVVFDFDNRTGRLKTLENGITVLPARSGPRHFVFSGDGSKLYVINELGSSVMVFNISTGGKPDPVQTIPTVREGFQGKNSCAAIFFGKDNKFLYGSNRGENSIVVFKAGIDGLLSLSGHSSCGGDWPRSFTIDPSGKYLLSGNQRSDTISVFRINRKTGIPEGPVDRIAMKAPAFLEFWK